MFLKDTLVDMPLVVKETMRFLGHDVWGLPQDGRIVDVYGSRVRITVRIIAWALESQNDADNQVF